MRTAGRLSAALLALIVCGATVTEAQSYYYESTSVTKREGKKKGQSDVIHGWVDGPKVKLRFAEAGKDGQMKEGTFLLSTDAGETVYMVDPDSKTYYQFDLKMLEGFAGGMVDLQFSDVSMEKLGQKPGGTILGQSTTQYTWRTRFQMDMNVMGMKQSNRYDTMQDVWMTKALSGDAWKMFLQMMPSSMKDQEFVDWADETGLTDSFPMRSHSVTTVTNKKGKSSQMTSETEVTELRIESIPAAVFEIPADYTKAEMMPGAGEAGGEAGGPMQQLKGMFGKKKKKNDG